MKIISIVGARPQFIKAAMLAHAFDAKDGAIHKLVHTGQHHDHNMSQLFFDELGIPEPIANLGIANGTHGAMTGRMLIELEKVLVEEAPDRVVLYGDTDSTLAGALAAAKLNIPVAHVEAGLRSYNRLMPEELNRIVADDLSDLLFAPTKAARDNLRKENKEEASIHLSGDIMFDAALDMTRGIDEKPVLERFNVSDKNYILATLHRAGNTDDHTRLITWFEELDKVAADEPVLLPLHPRTRKSLMEAGRDPSSFSNIRIEDPVSYRDMAILTKHSRLVITDSGGLQKEAYFHRVPSLILRNETEWVELLQSGWSRLVQCTAGALCEACSSPPGDCQWTNELYGDGRAAQRIVRTILQYKL